MSIVGPGRFLALAERNRDALELAAIILQRPRVHHAPILRVNCVFGATETFSFTWFFHGVATLGGFGLLDGCIYVEI